MKSGRRSGLALYEVLAYATIMGVLFNVSTSVFLHTKRIQALGSLALDRNVAIREIESDFREAARASTRLEAAPGGLLLLAGAPVLSARNDLGRDYSAWRIETSRRLVLEKFRASADGKMSLSWRKTYPECVRVVSMELHAGSGSERLVELALSIDNSDTRRTVSPNLKFVACLSGAPK